MNMRNFCCEVAGCILVLYLWTSPACSPRLRVDNAPHYAAVTMTPGMNIAESALFLGGVPAEVSLDNDHLPVTRSLIGGIDNLRVNHQ